eukprot:6455422-Amphidinium_carterae.1
MLMLTQARTQIFEQCPSGTKLHACSVSVRWTCKLATHLQHASASYWRVCPADPNHAPAYKESLRWCWLSPQEGMGGWVFVYGSISGKPF